MYFRVIDGRIDGNNGCRELKKILILASIARDCEDEIICDLAEIYHIYDYRGLSPYLVATLVLGLGNNSRTKMKVANLKLTTEQMLLASIYDAIRILIWQNTKDATKNRNHPKSLLPKLMGTDETPKDELMSFATVEEFEQYMRG